ncbi:hypothetical protein CN946_16565 [Bacillus sp. AFS053548]|nr:hypothetical protein CN946_16565 [Bacillus sp. AFS053548]
MKKIYCAVGSEDEIRARGKILFRKEFFEIKGNIFQSGFYYKLAKYRKVYYSNIDYINYSQKLLTFKIEFKCLDGTDVKDVFISRLFKRRLLKNLSKRYLRINFL